MTTLKKNASTTIKFDTGYVSLKFGAGKKELRVASLAQWQHVFTSKQPDLTTGVYVYDPELYDPQQPHSRARKLLGQDELVKLGSIRNPLYFSDETSVSDLDPEHIDITLVGESLHLQNVGSTAVLVEHIKEYLPGHRKAPNAKKQKQSERVPFGYFPDYKDTNFLLDWYLRVIGYPFGSRRNEVRLVLNEVDAKPSQKILDIGCGDGIWTNYLASDSGAEVHGVDISKHDLDLAQQRADKTGTVVEYHHQDATQLDFESNSFDTVYSISTLEHTEDDQAILNEMCRVVKPGGKIVVSMPRKIELPIVNLWLLIPKPLRFFLQKTVREASTMKEYVTNVNTKFVHKRLYSLDSIKKKMKQAGVLFSDHRYHISWFGLLPHSLVHTLRLFEWSKTRDSSYSFFNQLIFAITFPFFYPFYVLDNAFPKKEGLVIVAVGYKPNISKQTKK